MSLNTVDEYWVSEHVREYLRGLGFVLPLDDMEPWIRSWDDWMGAREDFCDYRDKDGLGRVYEIHRRSIHPAMRVCKEWGSLLLNEDVKVVCEDQKATDWINAFFSSTNFMAQVQATVVRAFGLGTGAWALWVDLDRKKVRIRHYDARMVIPLTWDEDGVTECAFVTRAFYRGKAVDQLQMHLRGGAGFSAGSSSPSKSSPEHLDGLLNMESDGTYRIVTVCFDHEGNELAPVGVAPVFDTSCAFPTFAIVKPTVENTRVDMSPYGQSIFADAIDAIQAVDVAFDAMITEVDISKMRVLLSDVMFDREQDGKKKRVAIPFGRQDCTVFRKVMSTDDMIQEFAPALRTSSQVEAFRIALQMLGDLCGLGLTYFDFDSTGHVKTATEVSSDNSALMRNIARHEHVLEQSITSIARALLHIARGFGVDLPHEGNLKVMFDDSIIIDTFQEKKQDLAEVGVTMTVAEFRQKWYGEAADMAEERAGKLGV